VQKNYPHPKHSAFWRLVHTIGKSFYEMQGYHYSARSPWHKLKSLVSYLPLVLKFQRYLRKSGHAFIQDFYKDISEEYLQFLEAQVFIVAQAPLKEVNFLTAALALGYTFNETHYVPGGFSALFDALTAHMDGVKRSTSVKSIKRHGDHYTLYTQKECIEAKNVILNSTIYDSAKLFDDPSIARFYTPYQKLNSHQSSFMVYMTIKSDKAYEHHYQLIEKSPYPHTLSNAIFVSFSDRNDQILSPEGHYSITASIHTDERWWDDRSTYKAQKESLQRMLIKSICDILDIKDVEILDQFAATPKTFRRYLNRSQLGGNPMTIKNFLPKLPANDTPIEGLYHVGDSVYAAQGWPGVMLGVENLKRLLDV
jgi:phytoene dehydrogenase-like protein